MKTVTFNKRRFLVGIGMAAVLAGLLIAVPVLAAPPRGGPPVGHACPRTDSTCLPFTQIVAAPLAGNDICARTDSTCLPFTQIAPHLAGTVPYPLADLNGDSSVSTVRLASPFEGLNPSRPVTDTSNTTPAGLDANGPHLGSYAIPYPSADPDGHNRPPALRYAIPYPNAATPDTTTVAGR
jgi:hypothetical protein